MCRMQSTSRKKQMNLHVAFFMFVKRFIISTIETKTNWPNQSKLAQDVAFISSTYHQQCFGQHCDDLDKLW